jgi:hypothetical protein
MVIVGHNDPNCYIVIMAIYFNNGYLLPLVVYCDVDSGRFLIVNILP